MTLKSLESFSDESSIKEEVKSWSIDDCSDYIEKYEKEPNQSEPLKTRLDIVGSQISELAKDLDANKRKQTFKTWDYKEIVKYLSDSAPESCHDKSHPQWNPYKYTNTGICLWAKGYDVTRPLGVGSFGCVWECDGKAVKVMFCMLVFICYQTHN